MEPKEIREKVEQQFVELLKQPQVIKEITGSDLYGHSAGTPMEEWVKGKLEENGWEVYYPNVFLSKIFEKIGENLQEILNFLDKIWWGKLLATKKQIVDYLNGDQIQRWQQEGADLVLIRKNNLFGNIEKAGKVILINVKSHESSRESRAPNIMSAQRLLEYLHFVTNKADYKEVLDDTHLWFFGVTYSATGSEGIIQNVSIKDLFKLDISKIPQINFDAAIQIQWHVDDMVEKEQTKIKFIENLAESFINQWKKHSQNKTKKYEKLVLEIKDHLKEIQSKL